ncbi:unnamed protein product, partial [Ilex paraguariensis]
KDVWFAWKAIWVLRHPLSGAPPSGDPPLSGEKENFDKAEELYAETPMNWHDSVGSNALINGYLKMGKLDQAVRVFEGMMEKDVVSWSSMVDGYCRNGRLGEARVLFDRMEGKNVVTWTVMINGYVKMACFEDGFGCIDAVNNVFCTMKERDVVSWNSLIAGYVQAEEIKEAYKLFKEVPDKDVVSWTTMITGFSSRGMTGKSTELFKMMPEKDDVPWTALISGFVNNGECEEAIHWFIAGLAIKPRLASTCSCFENGYGTRFPHSRVWGALLGATRNHVRLELAKLAAQHLSELEPHNAAPYVVLFDLYSVSGNMKDEEQVRIAKKLKGIKKSPGCSWIMVQDKVTCSFQETDSVQSVFLVVGNSSSMMVLAIIVMLFRTITVMTLLVAFSFYGANQLKFHWVECYEKLLVGSVLCLVGVLTLVFHHHDGDVSSTGEHLHRKLIAI